MISVDHDRAKAKELFGRIQSVPLSRLFIGLSFCLLSAILVSAQEVKDRPAKEPLSAKFGFLSPEIYKIDFRLKNLVIRDMNGDGKQDIVVVNNLKNRIDILEQRKAGEAKPEEDATDVNEIPNDWRLNHRKISTTKTVGALEATDVDGDGLADFVYLGDPPGLYIEYQDKDGQFKRQIKFDVPDALQNPWSLDVEDVNSDKKKDIVFLGKEHLYISYQEANGQFAEPTRIRLSDGGGSLLRVLDFDGDGRNDIVFMSEDKQFPVRIRFQSASGRLGPFKRYAIDPVRGVTYANVDNKPGEEILIISDNSDRFVIYGLGKSQKTDVPPVSRLETFPFEKSGNAASNDVVVADVDGDKRTDVIVSDTDGARLFLYRQSANEGLDVGNAYPALLGTTLVRSAQRPDGKADILLLSERENSLGVSHFDGQRMTFPATIAVKEEPVVFHVTGTPEQRLYYVARKRGEGNKDLFTLRQLLAKPSKEDLSWQADGPELALDLTGKPYDLRSADVNGDGLVDLILYFNFQPPVVLVGAAGGKFSPVDKTVQGTLEGATPANTLYARLAGPKEMFLAAQNSFARGWQLEKLDRWKGLDQFDAGSSSASIIGLAALDLDSDGKNELAMYDRNLKQIHFLKEQSGVYKPWRLVDVGVFALRGTRTGDFNGDGKTDLLLFDANRMGIAYAGINDLEFNPIASYETDLKKGKLFDVAAGDLNSDGAMDFLLLEPIQHQLEIVTFAGKEKLKRAITWKVFEEKTFRQAARSIEPREFAIGDVDADGRNDIAVLVHDRILIYRQDPGPKVEQPRAEAKPKINPGS